MRSLHLLWVCVFFWSVTPFSHLWYPLPSLAADPGSAQKEPQQTPRVGINRPILRIGSQGNEVSELQAALKLLGYYTGKVDGVYTESTANAVLLFQQAAGLTPDGVVGSDTWNRLFPGSSTTAGNSAASPPANSSASFPVPSATRTTASNSQPPASKTAAVSSATRTTASNSQPPASKTAAVSSAIRTTASNSQPPASKTAAVSSATRTTASNSQPPASKTAATPRTYNRQATTTTTPRTYNRQATTTTTPRTYNRQATTTSTSRTYNSQLTRHSTSQAQSESNSSSQSNLPILRLGAQGSSVTLLQQRLRNLGFFKGTVNGVFNESTQAAVQTAQARFKLEPDGVVGSATWGVLLR